jgi:hypothetical protein
VWLSRWLRDFVYDLRFSFRTFPRSRAFAATTVMSLALGVGATTAIYSLVDQVILRPLPVRDPDRLVLVDWKGDPVANGFGTYNLMSYPICRDLEAHDRIFEGVLCRAATTVTLRARGDHEPVAAEIVSARTFQSLGSRRHSEGCSRRTTMGRRGRAPWWSWPMTSGGRDSLVRRISSAPRWSSISIR